MSAAEALIQTALLGEALDDGPALVLVADDEMRFIAVNESACRALGYTRDELLQLSVPDIARDPSSTAEFDAMLENGFRHGTTVLTRKDGTTTRFAYRATPAPVAAGVDR